MSVENTHVHMRIDDNGRISVYDNGTFRWVAIGYTMHRRGETRGAWAQALIRRLQRPMNWGPQARNRVDL